MSYATVLTLSSRILEFVKMLFKQQSSNFWETIFSVNLFHTAMNPLPRKIQLCPKYGMQFQGIYPKIPEIQVIDSRHWM